MYFKEIQVKLQPNKFKTWTFIQKITTTCKAGTQTSTLKFYSMC